MLKSFTVVHATSSSITATLSATKAGYAWCLALASASVTSDPLGATVKASAQGYSVLGGEDVRTNVTMTGLIALTDYTVYCYTEDTSSPANKLFDSLVAAWKQTVRRTSSIPWPRTSTSHHHLCIVRTLWPIDLCANPPRPLLVLLSVGDDPLLLPAESAVAALVALCAHGLVGPHPDITGVWLDWAHRHHPVQILLGTSTHAHHALLSQSDAHRKASDDPG
jgi:hypothetical protein